MIPGRPGLLSSVCWVWGAGCDAARPAAMRCGPPGSGVRGEVRLEGVRDLENRLAWADETIEPGARVVVVAVSGSRVQVTRA